LHLWMQLIHLTGHTQILLHNFVLNSTVTIDHYSEIIKITFF
jgi:hypothetical protein